MRNRNIRRAAACAGISCGLPSLGRRRRNNSSPYDNFCAFIAQLGRHKQTAYSQYIRNVLSTLNSYPNCVLLRTRRRTSRRAAATSACHTSPVYRRALLLADARLYYPLLYDGVTDWAWWKRRVAFMRAYRLRYLPCFFSPLLQASGHGCSGDGTICMERWKNDVLAEASALCFAQTFAAPSWAA